MPALLLKRYSALQELGMNFNDGIVNTFGWHMNLSISSSIS